MKFKRGLSLVLILGMMLAIPAAEQEYIFKNWDGEEVFVASQSGRDQAQNELDDIENQLGDLEDNVNDVENQLSEKAQALSELLADKAILEADIANTQVAIDQAKLDLESARLKEADSYADMKLRIQYMYENSTQDSLWDAFLNSDGIADLLNRLEYINQVHTTDRQMLEDHKAIVQEIEVLAAELEASMNNLVAMQEVYEHQEIELENAMAELEAEAENYQEQIAAAQSRAAELADYIEEQNRLIAIRQQEELERQKELERQQALQQQQQQNQQQDQQQEEQQGTANNTGTTQTPSTGGGYLTDPSYDPAFSSGVSGEQLVSYALQFVGNPYKWGGNSLTNGCDCSGFVNLIYRHFGFTGVPRQSQAFKSYGQPVSFENIKAGDIVVYPGHVAIYIGNGRIVEAQSTKAGITCNRSVTCSTITAIRRVL